MRMFYNGRSNNIYFGSLSVNDFYCNLSSYFCLSLILNNFFDIDCFDCLIDYFYFVRNFVNFFYMEVFCDRFVCKVTVV